MKTVSLISILCSGMIAFSGMASAQMASPDAYTTSFATQFRMGGSSISLPATGGNDTSCAPYDTALAPTTNTYLLSATNIPADAPKDCGCKDTAELRQARLQSADVKLEYFAQGCKYSGSESGVSIIRDMLMPVIQNPTGITSLPALITPTQPQPLQNQAMSTGVVGNDINRKSEITKQPAPTVSIPAVNLDSNRPKDPCLSPKKIIEGKCVNPEVASSALPVVEKCPDGTKDAGFLGNGKKACYYDNDIPLPVTPSIPAVNNSIIVKNDNCRADQIAAANGTMCVCPVGQEERRGECQPLITGGSFSTVTPQTNSNNSNSSKNSNSSSNNNSSSNSNSNSNSSSNSNSNTTYTSQPPAPPPPCKGTVTVDRRNQASGMNLWQGGQWTGAIATVSITDPWGKVITTVYDLGSFRRLDGIPLPAGCSSLQLTSSGSGNNDSSGNTGGNTGGNSGGNTGNNTGGNTAGNAPQMNGFITFDLEPLPEIQAPTLEIIAPPTGGKKGGNKVGNSKNTSGK